MKRSEIRAASPGASAGLRRIRALRHHRACAVFALMPREESSSCPLKRPFAAEHDVFGAVHMARNFWRKFRVRNALRRAFAAEQRALF
jgi:hypothetical protein